VRAAAATGLGLLLVALAAPSASAHDRLVESDPATGAVLTAVPDDVVLTFNVDVQPLGTALELRDSSGEQASAAETTVSGREVSLPVSADLPDGSYTLLYRVTSSDGHPISGELPFTLEGTAAAPTQATGPADPTTTPAATPAPTTSPATSVATTGPGRPTQAGLSDSSDREAESAATTSFPWVVLGGLVVVIVAVGVGVAARRRAGTRAR
jgi:methionine-rich copper-binding protein CopC